MNIIKIETNYKRNFFWNNTEAKHTSYINRLENQIINIYPELEFQEIIGFGGAFTESSGYSFSKLPEEKKQSFLKEYFSKDGLNYNMGRLPIGSSDFSLDSYSYCKKKDLSDFSIENDEKFILPFLRTAKQIQKDLILLSSPWSPPVFMKSNNKLVFGGKLLDKYKGLWANYYVKYIKEYEKKGININYITVQNEPNAIQTWESCIYSPKEEIDFVTSYLYPTFKANNINTKILIWDHNKERIYKRAVEELKDEKAKEAVCGIAYHYYSGDHFDNLKLVNEKFPEKLLIHTEGCTGYSNFRKEDEIINGEIYAHDIIGDLNSGTNAYIDWNLLLDNKGGPNHKNNFCNSPIMLNKEENDYIKNLTYYYIGHFSKYIQRGARRIGASCYTSNIEVTAFENIDGSIIVILLNRNDFNMEYNICIKDRVIHDNLDSHAIVSFVIT